MLNLIENIKIGQRKQKLGKTDNVMDLIYSFKGIAKTIKSQIM